MDVKTIDYSKRKRVCIDCGEEFFIPKYVFKNIIENHKKFPERCDICKSIYLDNIKKGTMKSQ